MATKKAKSALLDEVLVYRNGEAVQFKPEKKGPTNRKGKRFYTDEVIAALRPVWVFFWYKCGRTYDPQILAPLMRQQMRYIAGWPAFHITEETAEKLKKIRPASIDRYLKKDKAALRLKVKRRTKPLNSLKSRPYTHLLHR
ncbi:MAG: hypothetical protein LBU25_02645 [Treponema sp.]|nr:hypothetical protein [Treponema sp.]